MKCQKCNVEAVTVWMMLSSFQGCPICKEEVKPVTKTTELPKTPSKPVLPNWFGGGPQVQTKPNVPPYPQGTQGMTPRFKSGDEVTLSATGAMSLACTNAFGVAASRKIVKGLPFNIGMGKDYFVYWLDGGQVKYYYYEDELEKV